MRRAVGLVSLAASCCRELADVAQEKAASEEPLKKKTKKKDLIGFVPVFIDSNHLMEGICKDYPAAQLQGLELRCH